MTDHENIDTPGDVVPMNRRKRPNKATVKLFLEGAGGRATIRSTEPVEDVDGNPVGVHVTETSGTLVTRLAELGWTQAEYDDPAVTE